MRVIKTGNEKVDRVLEDIRKELRNERGTFLAASMTAGEPYRFVHNLGRHWSHWFLTRTTVAGYVAEVNVASTDRRTELWLEASADGDIEIFLF